jgi:hypothetical protein
MNGSKNPTQQFIKKAAAKASLVDPTEVHDEFEYGVDQKPAELFKKELQMLAEYNDLGDGRRRNVIQLPPATVFGMHCTDYSKTLHCAGYDVRTLFVFVFVFFLIFSPSLPLPPLFPLRSLEHMYLNKVHVLFSLEPYHLYSFPDCFVLVRDKLSKPFGVTVLWVLDMSRATPDSDVLLTGREFQTMSPSWTNRQLGISYDMFHSYVVSDLNEQSVQWPASAVVGKGRCYCLDYEAIHSLEKAKKQNLKNLPTDSAECNGIVQELHWRTPGVGRQWLFNLLGQCLDYH